MLSRWRLDGLGRGNRGCSVGANPPCLEGLIHLVNHVSDSLLDVAHKLAPMSNCVLHELTDSGNKHSNSTGADHLVQQVAEVKVHPEDPRQQSPLRTGAITIARVVRLPIIGSFIRTLVGVPSAVLILVMSINSGGARLGIACVVSVAMRSRSLHGCAQASPLRLFPLFFSHVAARARWAVLGASACTLSRWSTVHWCLPR